MIDLDFSGDSQRSSAELLEEMQTPVPDGAYTLIIVDAEVQPSKKEGKKSSLKVVLKLTEDEKKTIWKYFYLDKSNDLSMAFLREFLEAAYGEQLSGHVQLNPPDLIGRRVIGHVEVQPRSDDPDKMQNVINVFESV